MDGASRPVAFLAFVLGGVAFARAAEVRVVDHNGAPVPDAVVVCLGREVGSANAGADGVAVIPDACKKVHCERGDFVGGEALLANGKAICRLSPALLLTVEPTPAGCDEESGCFAALISMSASEDNRTEHYFPHARGDRRAPQRFRFTATRPGRYRLEVARVRDNWTCAADLGDLAAGERALAPVWREPVAVRGIVQGVDGNARAGVPLQVRPPAHLPDKGLGVWRCGYGRWATSPPVSAADGAFTVLVDPTEKPTIEAGAPDDADGYAAVVLDSLPPAPLVLRLRPPAPKP